MRSSKVGLVLSVAALSCMAFVGCTEVDVGADVSASQLGAKPEHGLRVDWFDLFSTPKGKSYVGEIAIAHDDASSPAKGIRGTLYSARFSGKIAVAKSGEHRFFATADDGVRLFIDDALVLDAWSPDEKEVTASARLDRGTHEIRVEYYQDLGSAKLSLEWQPPGAARARIPEDVLTPPSDTSKDAKIDALASPRPTFTNPVIPFSCPDPNVFVDDEGEHPRFYLVCTGGSMTVRASDDMIRWAKTKGAILPGGKASWSANGDRNWAPEIHKVGGHYVAYYTAVNAKNILSIGAASAPAPDGPYTDLGKPLVEDRLGAIDATYFEDTDGKRYLYYKLDGNASGKATPILVRELAEDGMSFAPGSAPKEVLTNDKTSWEGLIAEAPCVVKRDGEYFLFYSGNVYDNRYREGVAKASSPLGPFTKKGPPILTDNASWVGAGHGTVITVHGRDYFFHHARPTLPNGEYDREKGRFGLITAVTWKNGWPVLGDGTSTIGPQLWP